MPITNKDHRITTTLWIANIIPISPIIYETDYNLHDDPSKDIKDKEGMVRIVRINDVLYVRKKAVSYRIIYNKNEIRQDSNTYKYMRHWERNHRNS